MLVAASSGLIETSSKVLPGLLKPTTATEDIKANRGKPMGPLELKARSSKFRVPRMLGSKDRRLMLKFTGHAFYQILVAICMLTINLDSHE